MAKTITCLICGFDENTIRARFCGQCASPLPVICSTCGQANPPGARVCNQCASPLTGTGALASRRLVTVLFVDVCNSTALTAMLGAETMYTLLDETLRRMALAVQRFEGTIDKIMGDGLMAVFGMPVTLEQHALQASFAAEAMMEELAQMNEARRAQGSVTIQLRLGLASGEVVSGGLGSETAMTVVGDVVNLAARLQQHADPDTILIDQQVATSVAPIFELLPHELLTLKGFAKPVPAFVLKGRRVQPGLLRGLSGQRTPLVGRQEERNAILDTLRGLKRGRGNAILLSGPAGIGKSRLVGEVMVRLQGEGVHFLQGECYSHTRTVPYSAFADLIRDLAGVLPTDTRAEVRTKINGVVGSLLTTSVAEIAPYLEYILSLELVDEALVERMRHLDPAQLKRQIFIAVRSLLVALSKRRPLVLVLDDLQWADELSRALIVAMAESLGESPLGLMLISRDETPAEVTAMFAAVETLAGGASLALTLQPLSAPNLWQMAQVLLPQGDDEMIETLVQSADGNPFYLEELVRHALETLPSSSASVAHLPAVPPSVEALIRGRFDRLTPSMQEILARASVIGRTFTLPVLRALNGFSGIEGTLDELRTRSFVQQRRPDGDEWGFIHLVTQETIYNSLLQQQRRSLHGQIGMAMEQLAGDRLDEQVDVLAYHFSRSAETQKAISYLLRAAGRAAGRYANDEALRLYAEAERLLDQVAGMEAEWVQLQGKRADVLALVGRYTEAREGYERALDLLTGEAVPRRDLIASLQRRLATTYARQNQYDEAEHRLALARRALGSGAAGRAERARIDAESGWIAFSRGDLSQAERLLRLALATAELLHDRSLQMQAYNRLAGVNFRRGDLDGARVMVQQSLEMSEQLDDQMAMARAYNNLGLIANEQAKWADAEAYCLRAQEIAQRNGDVQAQLFAMLNGASAQIMQGSLTEAMQGLEAVVDVARRYNITSSLGYARLNQGRAALFLGTIEEARRFLLEAWLIFRQQRSDADIVAVSELLGRVALKRGRPTRARQLAQRALALAAKTQMVLDQYRAHRLLALIAAQHGAISEANQHLEALGKLPEVNDAYEQALTHLVSAEAQALRSPLLAAQLRSEAQQLFDQNRIPTQLRRLV